MEILEEKGKGMEREDTKKVEDPGKERRKEVGRLWAISLTGQEKA